MKPMNKTYPKPHGILYHVRSGSYNTIKIERMGKLKLNR